MRFLPLLGCALAAYAYVPWRVGDVTLLRPDFLNVQFFVSESVAAGLRNGNGAVLITEDSDPMAAFQASANTWSTVPGSAVRFLPLERAGFGARPDDSRNVIAFADSPELESFVGGALAQTVIVWRSDGVLVDTDVVFSSKLPFSSTGAAGTPDLEAVVTHEIGHALGAHHSGLIGAVMYPFSGAVSQRHLAADDMAFLRQAYPADGALAALGSIEGRVTFEDGRPVRGASVVAINLAAGATLQAVAASDGSYRIAAAPPGEYQIYAEPLDGPVRPAHVGIKDADADIEFRTTFRPPVSVTARETAAGHIAVANGTAPFGIELSGLAAEPSAAAYPLLIKPGEVFDIRLLGAGLGVAGLEVQVIGKGLSVVSGSLREDRARFSGYPPPVRFTIEAAPDAVDLGTLILRNESGAVAWSGGIRTPPAPKTEIPAEPESPR